MMDDPIGRKEFLARLGRIGAGTCMCALAAGAHGALGGSRPAKAQTPEPPKETQPGEKSAARAAKRMEFADEWLPRFFETMDRTLDAGARRSLMMANGKACFEDYAGPRKEEPRGFERFARWVAEEGGRRGYAIDGRVVTFEYTGSAETGGAAPEGVCLCPIAEAQTPGKLSPTFCLCSLGYVKEMHERAIGRPVEVELADSVLRGGKRCRFVMTIG